MSSKSTGLSNALLLLVFNNDVPALGVLDSISDGILPSPTDGNLYVSLHDDDVGEAGTQATNELIIQNYVRRPVARVAVTGWTVSGDRASNAAQIRYPATGNFGSTGAPQDAKFVAIGTDSTGAGVMLYNGHMGEQPQAFTAVASTDFATVPGTTLVDTNEVFVYAIPGGGALPVGLPRGLYFVTNKSGDTFQLETSVGGGVINFTTDGEGYIAKVLKKTLADGDNLTFEIDDVSVYED